MTMKLHINYVVSKSSRICWKEYPWISSGVRASTGFYSLYVSFHVLTSLHSQPSKPQSLSISLTNLHSPLTPSILRTAIPTILALIDVSTPPGSQVRFDKLCALLGDGIIGNVWIYTSTEVESIQATLEVLPDVIEMLGIGCARYLKALVPQLIHPLLPSHVSPSRDMQTTSLRALDVLVKECSPRMPKWKDTILDAVAKCWVCIVDLGLDDPGSHIGLSFNVSIG
jgi:hypothetical protein